MLGVRCAGIRLEALFRQLFEMLPGQTRVRLRRPGRGAKVELQAVHLTEQVLVPLQRGIVDGKHTRQSAPFGRHIAN